MEKKLMKALCSGIFCIFSFCYLYFYQADIMGISQHLASNGQTFYRPLAGAVLITMVLKLIQTGVNSLAKLSKRSHALTYLPSILILTALSSISPDVIQDMRLLSWVWLFPLLLILSGLLIVFAKRYQPYEPELRSLGFLSQLVWINLGTLFLMFTFVGLFSNGNRYFHQRARVETLIYDHKYADALAVIRQMPHTDSVTTMLTIYALARRGHLQDSLFEYPLTGGSAVLRPGRVHSLLQPDSVLIKATRKSAHYQLTGFLLDRDLRSFARYLPHYYPVDSVRPRYYSEAFYLYVKRISSRDSIPSGSYANYFFNDK